MKSPAVNKWMALMHLEKVKGEISLKISFKLHILACYDRVIRSQ